MSPVGVFLFIVAVLDILFNLLGVFIPFFGSMAETLTEFVFEIIGIIGAVWIENMAEN